MGTVLYVEDHPPAQMLMQAIVGEMTPHQLQVASSGAEARAMAEKLSPDLYIVDMDLPDGDGVSLAQTLTAIHRAPVLLVSAYAPAIKESTIRAVIYAYLAKHLDPSDVASTIELAVA